MQPRSDAAVEHIDRLIAETRASGLPVDEVSLYLRDQITFDDTAKASDLLEKVTAAAVASLAPTQPATTAAHVGNDATAEL